MKITKIEIELQDLVKGYSEDNETGHVVAYNGLLDVRPIYQREFVYDDEKQEMVIDTVLNKLPLNVFYWVKREDETYEVLDGQQRTMSICRFMSDNGFSVKVPGFENKLPYTVIKNNLGDIDKIIREYKIEVFICEGTDSERLAWFKRINIAGSVLTNQEILNAQFAGKWCSSAKAYFSKPKGRGVKAIKYADTEGQKEEPLMPTKDKVPGGNQEDAVIRQKYLETAIKWAGYKYNQTIEEYMAAHHNDENANELWNYINEIVTWVRSKFKKYRALMKDVDWGMLYKNYKDTTLTADELERRIKSIEEKDISYTNKIYEAVLSGKVNFTPRAFSQSDADRKFIEQNKKCAHCPREFKSAREMQADHIIPWSKGGLTVYENLQLLCPKCNNQKKAHDEGYLPWDNRNYEDCVYTFDENEENPVE